MKGLGGGQEYASIAIVDTEYPRGVHRILARIIDSEGACEACTVGQAGIVVSVGGARDRHIVDRG